MLRQGLTIARRLLPQAITLTHLPVQVVISLQSAPASFRPDIGFAARAVHLALIRAAQDDYAARVEDSEQPVMAMTATAR